MSGTARTRPRSKGQRRRYQRRASIDGTLAFMFETRWSSGRPRHALDGAHLQTRLRRMLAGPAQAIQALAADMLEFTHDRRCQLGRVRQRADTDFPIQNLPWPLPPRRQRRRAYRGGVAIGDQVLDLARRWASGAQVAPLLRPAGATAPERASWRHGRSRAHRAAPGAVARCLRRAGTAAGRAKLEALLVPQAEAEMALPARIGDYTDFYAGIHHATRSALFRPDNPLLPNYKWVPVGYHGRSSSIGVSRPAFPRPWGRCSEGRGGTPVFAPSARLDYELELGVFIGPATRPAAARIAGRGLVFGAVPAQRLVGARPAGLGVPAAGPVPGQELRHHDLAVDRHDGGAGAVPRSPFERDPADPQPLPYLDSAANRERGGIAIALEVWIQTRPCARGQSAVRVSASSFADAYWTPAQLLAHHASNGCNLQPGDLMGSGTQSGPNPEQGGSLLELSQGGKLPFTLPTARRARSWRTAMRDPARLVRAPRARGASASASWSDRYSCARVRGNVHHAKALHLLSQLSGLQGSHRAALQGTVV
jgi:fumarylacetoacetase